MARSRVKLNLKQLEGFLKKAQPAFNEGAVDKLGGEIDASIGKGLSPVKGVARYDQYKPSYQASIKAGRQGAGKRVRPVNLTKTGDLRKSQKVKEAKGKVSVEYRDYKAPFHNEGTPNMARRPLLPTRQGEEFSRVITKFLKGLAIKSIDAVLK